MKAVENNLIAIHEENQDSYIPERIAGASEARKSADYYNSYLNQHSTSTQPRHQSTKATAARPRHHARAPIVSPHTYGTVDAQAAPETSQRIFVCVARGRRA